MAKKVKIYSTPTCIYCKLAKDFFKKNKIKYEEFDVSVDEKAQEEMIRKTQQLGVPVIEVNGKIFIGFDKPGLEKALNLKS